VAQPSPNLTGFPIFNCDNKDGLGPSISKNATLIERSSPDDKDLLLHGKKRKTYPKNRPVNESLSEKSELAGGEGFWLCARRTVPRIPKAGCKERANEAHRQKHRRRPVPIF
jgi:hypothetical protein